MRTVRSQSISGGAGLLAMLTGCNLSTASETPTTAPLLPPLESIGLDVSFFRHRTPLPGVGTSVNWTTALERIAIVESTVGLMLALPSATMHAASAQAPQRQRSAWRWSYSITVQGVGYEGALLGGVNGAANAWQMLVSSPGRTPPLANQTLFEGISGFFGGSGQWLIPDLGAAAGERVATIQWQQADQNSIGYVFTMEQGRWTYTRQRQVHNVDYLTSDVAPWFRLWWDVESGRGAVSARQERHVVVCHAERSASVRSASERPMRILRSSASRCR
jgi:hypothetical protein